MNGAKNAVVAAVIATGAAWMLSVAVVGGQAAQAPADRAPNSEDVFKNIQVLKGIPVDQFMGTMGFFSSSLGLNCTDCHLSLIHISEPTRQAEISYAVF